MGSLDGKVAIVTGAGQGVGEGIAFALAKEGATLVVAGRTESKVVRTAKTIREFGGKALAVGCDVCKPADIASTVERTLKEFGGIDILVNNAQIVHNDLIDNLTDQQFTETFDSGPFATFRFMKAVHPHMRARGGGNIINLRITSRSIDFWELLIDIQVHDLKHLTNIIAVLRATPVINQFDRARSH